MIGYSAVQSSTQTLRFTMLFCPLTSQQCLIQSMLIRYLEYHIWRTFLVTIKIYIKFECFWIINELQKKMKLIIEGRVYDSTL